MNQITFKQYRTIDIMILVALTVVFEAITTLATAKWFAAQPVALSIGLAMVCMVMMRWGWQALIPAVAGGFVYCIITGGSAPQYVIYCVGNVFALVAMVLIRHYGKERLRSKAWLMVLFGTTAYAGMVFGRWLVSLMFGENITGIVDYATTDIMTLVFTVLVLLVFRKADGMLEDQKAYLFRLERERKAKQEEPM